MAQCTYTFGLEWHLKKKLDRIKFFCTLDTFTEDGALRGLAGGRKIVEKLYSNLPEAERKLAYESFEASNKIALSKIRRLARAKFKMGDYTDHILKLNDEIREIVMRIRSHDCGPDQHPENLRTEMVH